MLPRLRRLLAPIVVLASLFLGGSPALAQQGPEVVGIELEAHADQAALGRRGMVSIVGDVAAGGQMLRRVKVSNGTQRSVPIDVYVGGAEIVADGFQPNDDDDLIASWSTLSEDRVVLEPGEERLVELRIDVPAKAIDGEHYAVVWVQPPDGGGDIKERSRVGIRIYLTTFGGVPRAAVDTDGPPVDFIIESMTAARLDTGEPQVRARVRNTGRRALDVVGNLNLLEGPGGLQAGPYATDGVTTIAIGGSANVVVTLPAEVPVGPWLARLVLSSGATDRAAEAVLTFPVADDTIAEEVPAEMTPVERQRRVLLPIATTMIVTVLTLLAVLALGEHRRRKKARAAASAATSPDDRQPVAP